MKGRNKCFFCVICPLLITKHCWINDRDGRGWSLSGLDFSSYETWGSTLSFDYRCCFVEGSGEGRLVLQLSAFVERYYSIQNVSSVVIVPAFLFALLYSRAGWGLPGAATAVWWGWGSALVLCLTVLQGWGESVRNAQSWAHVPRLITDQRISRLYIGLLPRSSKG